MKIFGLIGWSGSGKTTLIKALMPALIERGYSVSSMKHTHHDFDMDKPGKDSYEHRMAGARQVLVTGAKRWALLTENSIITEPPMEELLSRMDPVDLILIEGFKSYSHPKMEIYRSSLGKPLLATNDPTITAVASDNMESKIAVPIIELNDVSGIADFIIDYCDLDKREKHGTIKG